MMRPIYLDHAAATPMLPEVKTTLDNLPHNLGNPSSVHQAGVSARMLIDDARQKVANYFEAALGNIIFTSGATESLNLAIVGAYLAKKKTKGIIYLSPVGHSAVFGPADFLAKHFDVTIKYLPITSKGVVDLKNFETVLIDNPDIVVCEYGNSELGLLQPVAKIGKILIKNAAEKGTDKPIFIVDAAAAIVTEKVSLDYQKCEAIAVSGEKIGALPGFGVLLKSEKLSLTPIQKGSHEFGLRGGTENWWGITAFAQALKYLVGNQSINNAKYLNFQRIVRHFFETEFPTIKILTPTEIGAQLPHVFHFVLPKSQEKAALFIIQADLAGLQISAGSACSSGSVGGSRALSVLDLDPESIERGIRLSFGWDTSENDVLEALEILKKCL